MSEGKDWGKKVIPHQGRMKYASEFLGGNNGKNRGNISNTDLEEGGELQI